MADPISKPVYYSSVAVFTSTGLDSLASSTSLVAGLQSAVVDNTTNRYLDGWLAGKFKVNNTAPTAAKQIEVWVGALLDDTVYPDQGDGTAFGATEAAKTFVSVDVKNNALVNIATIPTDATANRIYTFSKRAIAGAFAGGVLPPKWFVWVTQSTGQALNVTGSAGGQVWFTAHQVQGVTT